MWMNVLIRAVGITKQERVTNSLSISLASYSVPMDEELKDSPIPK